MLDTFVLFKLCRAEVSHRELVCLLGPEPTSCCTPARLPAQEQTQKPSWSGLSAPVTSPLGRGPTGELPPGSADTGEKGAGVGAVRNAGAFLWPVCPPVQQGLVPVELELTLRPLPPGRSRGLPGGAWSTVRVGRPSAGLSWRSQLASAQRSRHGSLPCSGQTPDRQEGPEESCPQPGRPLGLAGLCVCEQDRGAAVLTQGRPSPSND